MRTMTRWLGGAAVAATLLAAAPASAQYYYPGYDPYYDRDPSVDRVVSGINAVVGAVAGATQGYYDPYYGNRYGNNYGNQYGYNVGGAERFAVDACAYEAQRRFGRRYGVANVAIRDVRYSRYDRVRVHGAVDLGGGYGYGDRYGYSGYGRGRVAFSCSVRRDGRVTDFDTHNYDW